MRDITPEANVFVKNMDPTLTVKILDTTFSKFGNIFSSKIAVDENGESLGYGYIQFENKEGAEKCINEGNNIKIKDKLISVTPFLNAKNREDCRLNLYLKNLPNTPNLEEKLKVSIILFFIKK